MAIRRYGKPVRWAALAGALALTATACGGGDDGASDDGSESAAAEGEGAAAEGDAAEGEGEAEGADGEPIPVGVITSTSGLVASYGQQFTEGFEVGLDYATDGTGTAGGRPIEATFHDDAGDPAQATAEATDLIGQGYQILTGSVSSGVALQMAPLAEQNDVLYIAGAAAADPITGVNDHTFRSGRQTYQDVKTAEAFIGDIEGSSVAVFAQDDAFGQANVAAVSGVLGDEGGAEVSPVLVPLDTTDFTPFARQLVDAAPDLVFVAWAGDSTNAMWQTLSQQGVFDDSTVVTGLAERTAFDDFGPASEQIDFLAHYVYESPDNEVNEALADGLGATPDIFHADGFVAAQMVVHAIEEGGGDDVAAMIDALEGWTFQAPKGEQTIRPEDHAMLQPMFQAGLVEEDGELAPSPSETLPADVTAPPVAAGE
jgi:branched-chain amino acid transport system substrate-binding protein